jgi:hypothetical protein
MQDPLVIENLVKFGKHFCVLPWVHFHSWPDGKVMPCCVADSNMPVANLNDGESIIQMMNSEAYKEIRSAMLIDEPVQACRRCYDLELLGTWTMRKSHNKRRGLEYVSMISNNTDNDGTISDFEMKYMDLRFSNMCNMKCRSCGPGCSSLWAQEYIDKKGTDEYEKHFKTTKVVINTSEEMSFMNKLKPYLKDVLEVYFAGGEIIITPEHYECLDYWIENGLTDQVELTYTTNFSSMKFKDKDLLGYWKKFPQLKIWASLDAHGDVAETIRKGTDWQRIVNNIKTLKEQLPHAQFQITPTISIWNVFSFPDFFDYLVKENLIDLKTSSPRFNLATSPWYANIMILPSFIKRELVEIYKTYVARYEHINTELSHGFTTIIQNLSVGEENKGGILEFKKFNDELDTFRNEKIEDVIPKFKELYQWAES